MSSDLEEPKGPMPAAEVYDRVADVLSWAAERRAEAGADDEAIDLVDAALSMRRAAA